LLAPLLVGCFALPPVPVPVSGTKAEVVEQLRIGESDRADVHALLGDPNRLASARHEVWDLDYDPFHMYFIIGFGGPGGGGATDTPIYFGDTPSRTRLVVRYDEEGKVAGWRWEGRMREPVGLLEGERFRDYLHGNLHGTSQPDPTPVEPPWVLPEPVEAYASSRRGDPASEMEKEVAGGARSVRQIGRFVIVDREDGGVSVWDVAGDRVAVLASDRPGYVASSATISADGSRLAVEMAVEPGVMPTVILNDIATGKQRALTLPGPAKKPRPLAALALAPKANLLAIHRWTHIEVWRLGTSDEAPVLETALPLPPPTMAGPLGFSADGSQLVAESLGAFALVWETAGWQVIGRGMRRAFSSSSGPSGAVERDAGGLAYRARPPSAPTATTNRLA
jgi:hypothetical protein